LFQEGERVSSDRLFRVRSKQPNSSEFQVNMSSKKGDFVKALPQKCTSINVGDLCVFKKPQCKDWTIGKIFHFFYPGGKTSKSQQRKETSMKVLADDGKQISVVCTWFKWHTPLSRGTFNMSPMDSTSNHCRINEYAFTLIEGCFEVDQMQECIVEGSIFEQNAERLKLVSSNYLIVSKESMQFIEDNLRKEMMECSVIDVDDVSITTVSKDDMESVVWKKYGCCKLTIQHRSQLLGGHLLCDIHLGAAQALIHKQFPSIGGLTNTVLQDSKSIQPFVNQQNIQIIHVLLGRVNHWIVLSTMGCGKDEVVLYDSLQMKPNIYTNSYCQIPKNRIAFIHQ